MAAAATRLVMVVRRLRRRRATGGAPTRVGGADGSHHLVLELRVWLRPHRGVS